MACSLPFFDYRTSIALKSSELASSLYSFVYCETDFQYLPMPAIYIVFP
jgi:hypothetical protein